MGNPQQIRLSIARVIVFGIETDNKGVKFPPNVWFWREPFMVITRWLFFDGRRIRRENG